MSDLTTRFSVLPAEKRALLAQLLKKKAGKENKEEQKSSSRQTSRPALRAQYDVVILGGGLAGLTLAMQIKQARPETSILVAEKRKHPVPEAAFKVGESTIEGSTYYLGEILGMKRHLHTEQLVKLGLRYFFPAGENRDIAQRFEVGPFSDFPWPSYQIDRGRFENALVSENRQLGVAFWDACKVQAVSLSEGSHSVTLLHDEAECTVKARWVVDASGRAGLLKRQLGIAKSVSHDINAAWFRISEPINLGNWSQEPMWQKRIFPGLRRLSTNHLMGEGYWVWLIPLASGSTSIGIVADASFHRFNKINRLERALSWLRIHEPQLAQVISKDRIQDFRVLKRYAHSCAQVFSTDRWGITGEAGVFSDPFYSMGSDLIAISNIFITDLIVKELAGERIEQHVEFYNRFYLDFVFDVIFKQYQGQYPLMGNSEVMTAKIVWDFAWYWATLGLLIFHHKLCDLDFMSSVEADLLRFQKLHTDMQAFFPKWHAQGQQESCDGYVNYGKIDMLYQLHCGLAAGLTDQQLKNKVAENVSLLERIAGVIRARAEGVPRTDLKSELNKVWLDGAGC